MNIQKIKARETSIRARMITHVQAEVLMKFPKAMFMPKKLAIKVGGMSRSETNVNTFMILF